MATGLVRCDNCERTVKQPEAHGWLEVKVWVTKPSEETLEYMRSDPSMAKMLDSQGITSGELPALIGGDFCGLRCLVKFYQAQETLESLSTTEDPPPPPTEPTPTPIIHQEPDDLADKYDYPGPGGE